MDLEQFTVENGRITTPGKFEGEALWVPYFWDQALNGMADEDDGKVYTFQIAEEDINQFPELAAYTYVDLFEDEQGFVHSLLR